MNLGLRRMNRDSLVEYAYKLFLGRNPESNSVLKAKRGMSIEDLRKEFMESYEFRVLNRSTLSPEIHSEFIGEASHDLLDSYLAETISQWKSLGELEPYWSVLSSDLYKGDLDNQQKEGFYLSGKIVVDEFVHLLEARSVPIEKASNVLELGCGVGRITKSLASQFNSVTAIDISPGNLAIARMELSSYSNVHFVLADEMSSLDKLQSNFDVFLSVITLQHNPPEIQRLFLENMLSKLKKNGSIAYFQTVTHITKRGKQTATQSSDKKSFDTFAYPMHEILKTIKDSGFEIFEVYRDDWQLDPDYHSYSFYLKN
jgi:2-polyprenyl-3-methyl-5-hydroxy-6-metoxy-1,4-benzoquinol methylase